MILDILKYPDKRLRTIAQPVVTVNSEIKKQVKDMFETMYDAPGIGLAATQVNFHQRIIVIDISEDCNQPFCLINPEIIEKSGEIEWEEVVFQSQITMKTLKGQIKLKYAHSTNMEIHLILKQMKCLQFVFSMRWTI